MAIFSKYSRVVEPSGDPMSVRDALQQINSVLDEVLSEQEGDFDRETRWCVAWFEQNGFNSADYGSAELLANAKNVSVSNLARSGVLTSGANKVKLHGMQDLSGGYDPLADERISLWEVVIHMAKALGEKGLDDAGRILLGAEARGLDMTAAHELAYLLFAISEKRKMTQAGILFNALGSSWPDIRAAAEAASTASPRSATAAIDFDALEGD